MKLRLFSAIMGVTVLVLLTLLIPIALFLRATATSQTINELEKNAFAIAGRSTALLWTPSTDATTYVDGVVRAYSAESGARVVVTDSQGVALVTTDADSVTVGSSYANRPEVATALSGEVATGQRHSNSLGIDLFYVAVPVLSGNTTIGAVRISYPAAEVQQRLDQQISLLWIVAVSAVSLAAIVALILASSITRPIRRLRNTAEAVTQGDLHSRSDEQHGPPEIRALAHAYNQMSDRLGEMLAEQQRFAADASHQLRSPLTALRLRLETAQELLAIDPERAATRLAAAEHEAERLGDIIEALLLLSRGELGEGSVEPIDVAAAAQAMCDVWAPLAEESGVTLEYLGVASLSALALPGAVEQVIGNLVDNAIRASQTGGRVIVQVSPADGSVLLRVLDEGSGMTAEELAHAFDRFWRSDTSTSGTGIGLAIVRKLVEASGGSVDLRPRSQGIEAVVALTRSE